MRRIGWSITHQEFTITDHYYFSRWEQEIRRRGHVVDEVDEWERLANYDVLVFNYPEIPFSPAEVGDVNNWLEQGKEVIILGYYKNEDAIADRVNSLTEFFGLRLMKDEVYDLTYNLEGDKLLLLTTRVHVGDHRIQQIFMPCTASVQWEGMAQVLAESEPTSWSSELGAGPHPIAVRKQVGAGHLTVVGTCVFWDNFAIRHVHNLAFSCALLGI